MKKLLLLLVFITTCQLVVAQTSAKYIRWEKVTTTQRNAIDTSKPGIVYEVYNTDTARYETYNGSAWVASTGTASTITALPYATIPATTVQAWLEDLKDEIDALAIGAGAVNSVNGQAGTVVLTTDNIDDSTAANKYVTASEKAAISTAVQTETDPLFAAWAYNYNNLVNTPTNLSEFTNDAGFITATGALQAVLTAGNVSDQNLILSKSTTSPSLTITNLTNPSLYDYESAKITSEGFTVNKYYTTAWYAKYGISSIQWQGGGTNTTFRPYNNANSGTFNVQLPGATGMLPMTVNSKAVGGSTGNISVLATDIPFTPNGSIAATTVQAAIQEVRDEAASGGSTTFSALTDTPSSYTGQAGKFTRVNTGATALEFTDLVQSFDPLTHEKPLKWIGTQVQYDIDFPSGHGTREVWITDATPPALYAMDISVIPSGNQTASDGQTAINLLQSQIDAIGSGSSTFTGLTDTPPNYTGHANKFLVVADNELSVKYSSMTFDENTATLNMLGDGGADDAAYIKVNDTEMFKLAQGNDFISTQRPFSALSGLTASGINASSQKITNVANGTLANDAVNKGQLDAINTAISVSSGAVTIGTGTGITGSSGFTWDSLNKNLNMNLGVNSDAAITFGGESNARFSYSELGSNRFTFNRNISVLSNKVINLADGTDPTDAVNRGQLDAAIAGVSGGLQATSIDTSAELASIVTDETGSGALVFATSPTLTTPNLGTPSAVNLTNATGLPHTAITGMNGTITTLLATSPNTSTGLITGGGTVTLTNKSIPLGSNTLTGLVTTGLGAVIDMGRMAQYNFGAASSATTFTMTNIAVGGEAAVLVNSATEPTVTGATKLPNTATFIANTDMVLFVKDFNGTRKYYFMQF